jgi:rubredoxin
MSDLHLTYRCPACQRVKGQRSDGSMDQEWCTMAEYVKRYPATRHNALISEFYCSDCSTLYDRLVQYGRTSQSCFR